MFAPLLSLALLAGAAYPDPPAPVPPTPAPVVRLSIGGDLKIKRDKLVRLTAIGAQPGAALIWDVGNEEVIDAEETEGRFLFTGPPGVYKVKLRAIVLKDGKTSVETARATVTVEGQIDPPQPGPGPNPDPGPKPDPAIVPFPANKLRVLIVYESAELQKLPAAQSNILFAKSVRDYLRAKTDIEDGTTAWRIWDADVATDAESKTWQEAMKRPRKQLPWIIIANNKSGYEGPLPSNVDETIKLLKKYGGE
jgi:hypothetical protein